MLVEKFGVTGDEVAMFDAELPVTGAMEALAEWPLELDLRFHVHVDLD